MTTTESSAFDRLQRFERNSQNLAAAQPAAIEAFWRLHKKTTATGALDRKTKELIALAISIVMRCDDCIAYHVIRCRELGLSAEMRFDDIESLATQCRFQDCQHDAEPGCAVLSAVANGDLDSRRLSNYQKLLRENAFHKASLADSRRQGRDLARKIRQVVGMKKKGQYADQ